MTNDCRAGTSICDSSPRTISNTTTHPPDGAKAHPTSSALAGRWVNTMVRTRPIRRASTGAAREESALSICIAASTPPTWASEKW